jgi:hypothetical protein
VPFVAVSFLGHAVYGTTMGLLARGWLGPASEDEPGLYLSRPSLEVGLS